MRAAPPPIPPDDSAREDLSLDDATFTDDTIEEPAALPLEPGFAARPEDRIAQVNEAGNPAKFGDDIGGDEETIISNRYDRPVMVHRYPKAIKAFYMKEDPDDARCALCVDVLAPEGYGEIIGGGQREESLETLERKIAEHKLPIEAFQWYLDLRRYGSFPHAGFGMGIERCVAWACGLPHVREAIPFPRMLNRLSP